MFRQFTKKTAKLLHPILYELTKKIIIKIKLLKIPPINKETNLHQ